MKIRVETYSGYKADERPTVFYIGNRKHQIVEVTDRWYDPSADYFKVKGVDGGVYILDEQMQPVAEGQYGQLYIAGDGLARGYLNREELTAKRFVQNPFDNNPNNRLYQSGDICRQSPDGTVEFQGRVDEQVKIRGYRIELGEIEHALRTCPGVKQAVVTIRQDTAGQNILAGYVVPQAGESFSSDALRSTLADQLPAHMIPNFLIEMPTLPLTANGKINRQALPNPQPVSGQERTPPQTSIEKQLAQLWRQQIRVDQAICREDNFFNLGGDDS